MSEHENGTRDLGPKGTATNPHLTNLPTSTSTAPITLAGQDASARAAEDGRLEEVGRNHPSFRYPVLKNPTGRVQYAIDKAESITVDPLGTVRRGEVISVHRPEKPPNAKALDFCRGLVAGRHFAHCSADTPLGVLVASTEDTKPDGPDLGEKIGDFNPPRGDETPLSVDFDFNGEPPKATFSNIDEANREHLATFDGTPESVKKSPK